MKHPVCALSMALLLTGCASHRIYSPNYDPRGIGGTPVVVGDVSILGRKATENSHVDEVKKVCGKADLVSVEVRKNVLESLASVLTLGMVSPARILFYCGKEPISGQ